MPSRPTFVPFTIRPLGLRFIDERDVSFRNATKCLRLRDEHLARFGAEEEGGARPMCAFDVPTRNALHEKWIETLETRPGMTWEEFEAEGLDRVHSAQPDRNAWHVNFCARDTATQEWVGGIYLGNFAIERDRAAGIQATALFFGGLPDNGTDAPGRTWGRIMRWIINNDLTTRAGKRVDVVGFDFLGKPIFNWTRSRNRNIRRMLAELDSDVDNSDDPLDADVIRRTRRKGTPV